MPTTASHRFICWNCEKIQGPPGAPYAESQLCGTCIAPREARDRKTAGGFVPVLVQDDATEGL